MCLNENPKQAPRVYPLKWQTLCYSLGLLVSANQHQEIENPSSTISLVFYTEMMDVCYSFIQRWWMCVSHKIKKKKFIRVLPLRAKKPHYIRKPTFLSSNQIQQGRQKYSNNNKEWWWQNLLFYLFTVFFIRDSKCNSLSNVRMR